MIYTIHKMDYKGSLKVICGLLILGATLIANANTTPNVTTLTKYGVGSILDNSLGETENDIFVTCYNYEGSVINVFYSSNNGISWTGKEGNDGVNDLPDSPIYSKLNNPYEEDEVIVGTELGVQKTLNLTDANPDWSLAYEGMSDVAVLDINFRETSALDNIVSSGPFGRGVYVSEFTSSTNPPVSTTDTITVIEGGMATTTTEGATSVLSNDSDPDGDPITMNLLSTTINGVLTISPSGTGSFTYIHNGSETTTDTFSYRASDGALFGNTVFVTIIVTPFNDCPIVQNAMPDIITSEDAVDKIIDFSAVFLDPEGSFLSYTVTHTNTPLLSASINTTSLTLDYTDNMAGSATVTITANDSGCGTLTEESFLVTVNAVNDLPTGVADTITVDEGGTATTTTGGANSVLSNDTDTDSDPLTVTKLTNPLHHTGGTFSLQSSGTFIYNHDGSETTTDTFNYTLSDGLTTTVVSVTINITPINDCPTIDITLPDITVNEDAANTIIDLSPNFSDAEGNPLSFSFTNDDTSIATVTLNTNTLTIQYIPEQSGTTTVTISVDDSNGCNTVQEIFLINITAVNDTPVGTPDTITVDEGGTATTTTGGANSVLSNDTDTDSDPLTVTKLTNPLHHTGGTFSLQSSGTFIYNHDGSETTTDTFNYTLSDGLTTTVVSVTINITPINDCPTIDITLPDITVNEDAANTIIDLSPNFSDAEGNPLSFSFTNDDTSIATVTLNTNTLTIQYIPEQSGTTTVTISVDDSNGCNTVQEIFLVNITAVNDPPVTVTDTLFVLEGGTVTQTTLTNSSLLANDTDTESDALEATQITPPANGTLVLSSTGTFTYIHNGSETTTDSFQYRAAETALGGQDGNIITVSITIQEMNDCPIYTAVGGFPAASEDGAAWTWNYGAEISDADGNTPLYTLTNTATNLLTAVTAANGIVTFTPKLNQSGSTTMTLNVSDGRGCDIDIEIPVVINPINDCPTLENPTPDVTASEDDPDLVIALAGIFADVDTTPLNYRTTIGNSSLIATSITATALIIDFLPNQSGSTFINLIALDGDPGCTVDDLFTVSITPVNDAPTGVGEVINLVNGASTSVLNDGVTNSVLANDYDPESDAITSVIVTGPINGTVALLANGNFTYTHNGSTTVTDSFTYAPRDIFSNIGNTTTVTIYINIVPVGVTETIALIEGGTATTTTAASTSVLSNDTDTDSITASLTASIGTSPLFGALVLNANGSFVYTHSGSEDFTDSFTYIPFDGKGYGLPTVVSITITPTNDPPVAFPDSITVGVGQTTSLLTGGSNNVLLNDTDPDGNPLTAELVTGTSSGTLLLNNDGTFSYTQNGVMDAGDSFTYKANDGLLDSNTVTVNIALTCSPCTEKTIEAGSSGVIISYRGCDCRKYDAYVPKGEVFIFCHLDGSVVIGSGSYTVLSSKVCY